MSTIPLGEDILLARHGSNIKKFRQDRKHRLTIAYLRTGGIDTASNQFQAAPVLTPAASFSRNAAQYLNDEAAVSRKEVRMLAKITLGYTAVATAVFGGLIGVLYRIGGVDALQVAANAMSMR